MEWSEVQGRWQELRGKIRTKWGDLTDDDVATMRGERDQLVGKLVAKCGYTPEQAEREVDAWMARLDASEPGYEHNLLEALWVQQSRNRVDPALLQRLLRANDHRVRAAATRAACTAGNSKPINIAMIAMTTSSSISVNARRYNMTTSCHTRLYIDSKLSILK